MNLPILSALALGGLGPFLGAVQDGATDTKGSAKQEKPAVDPDAAKTVWEYLSGRYDTNGDGKIAKDEYTRGEDQFARLDKDKNGFIEEADSKQASARGGRGERGERGARGGGGRGGRGGEGGGRPAQAPTEGSMAPDFMLETLYAVKAEGKEEGAEAKKSDAESRAEKPDTFESVKLSSLKGKKPVALIFGSYT